MRNTDEATIGVDMRPYERISIRLSEHRPFRRSGIRAVDRLCERCFESGRCLNDAYEGHWCIPADELGCPGWCARGGCVGSGDADKKILIDMLAGDDPKTVREHLESFRRERGLR